MLIYDRLITNARDLSLFFVPKLTKYSEIKISYTDFGNYSDVGIPRNIPMFVWSESQSYLVVGISHTRLLFLTKTFVQAKKSLVLDISTSRYDWGSPI